MGTDNTLFDELIAKVCSFGANHAGVISAKDIVTDESFRDVCASNACGMYGKCWMCPPYVGDIHELMAKIKEYDHALVYQLIGNIEDSYDFEGMIETKKEHYRLTNLLRDSISEFPFKKKLLLGAGGCGACEKCTKPEGLPCRHPDLAIPSLESYGVFVSRLAETAGMKYINGANTVTYFGVVLFSL